MTNPIRWLFRDKELDRAEDKLDSYINRIQEKVQDNTEISLVEVDINFPKEFERQSNEIAIGCLEWRDFYCNKALGIYSVHCKMTEGSVLREHKHPKFDEYIYVISGKIINWTNNNSKGQTIVPPERVDNNRENIEGWYKISAGNSHRLQSLEDNTHFVSKFIKPDAKFF